VSGPQVTSVKATDLSAGEFQLEFSDDTTYTLQAANSTLADKWIDAIEPRIDFARSQARKRGSLVPGSDGGGRGGAAAGVGDWGGSDAGGSRGGRSNSRGAASGAADDDEDGGRGGRRRRPTHRAASSGFVDTGTRRQDDFDGIDDEEPPAAAARGGGKPAKPKPEPVPEEGADGSGDSDGGGRRGGRKPLRGAGKSGKTASDDDGLASAGAAAAAGGAAAAALGKSRAPSPVKPDTGRRRSDDSEVSPAAKPTLSKPTLSKPKPEPEAGSDADSDAGGRGGKANGTGKANGGSATPATGRLGAASRPPVTADTDEDAETDGSEDGGRRGRGGRRAGARVASASGLPPAPSRKGWVYLRPTTRFGREARWYLTLAGGFLTMSSDADAAASAVSSQDVADILAVMPSTSGLRGGFSLLSRGDKQKRKFRAEDEAASREWIAAIREAKTHRERAKELRAAALTSKGAAGAGASAGKGRAKPRRRSSGGSVGTDTDEDGEGRSAARAGKRPASRKPLARVDSDEEEDKGALAACID